MPVTCPHCGSEAERRERFCEVCGAFLGWDAGQAAESQLFEEQVPSQDDQRAGVQIKIKNDLISVSPGNGQSTVVTIKNLGTQVEEFRFSVTGPQWLAVEPANGVGVSGTGGDGHGSGGPAAKPEFYGRRHTVPADCDVRAARPRLWRRRRPGRRCSILRTRC